LKYLASQFLWTWAATLRTLSLGILHMHKLAAVEEATALMEEAKNWSVWRWLLYKASVRAAADRAVAALNEAEEKVKAGWSDDMLKAYREFDAQQAFEHNSRAKQRYEKAKQEARDVDPEIKQAVQKVKEADDEAETSRLDAEETFAEAERQLSAGMARQGADKAIRSWELRMKAIRKAEAVARKSQNLEARS
jgi:hypothetical protein